MSPRVASAVACLLAVASDRPAAAFAPPAPSSASSAASSSSSASHPSSPSPSSALRMSSVQYTGEDAYPRLLADASLCARSETCPIEVAETYLKEIVHVQSGCAAGTVSGSGICDDVAGVSEVVAELRRKVREGASREVGTFWDLRRAELEALAAASDDGGAAAALRAPPKPAYLAFAALYAVAIVSLLHPSADVGAGGIVPFAPQEVWWAVRDGYVGDLASHLFRNGGLLVGDATTTVAGGLGGGLTPQEVYWSVRDGYAADALLSGGEGMGGATVPFTPQEVWWAIRHGYSYDMLEHWFRNGGLAV